MAVAAKESRPIPCFPAMRAPVGETAEATAMSTRGWVNGGSCSRASDSWNHLALWVTVSPLSSRTTTSAPSSSMSR